MKSKKCILERTPVSHPERSPHARHVRVERIVYHSNGRRITGFLLTPKTKNQQTYPCIIYNRGGSLAFGMIGMKQLFGRMATMTSWGYIVVASQYSGNDGSEGRDECGGMDVDDVLALKHVLEEEPCADTKRIGMYGGSRGGMMTYMALARVKWIKAAVSIAGVSDLIRNAKQRPEIKKRYKHLFGGSIKELKRRSVLAWPEKLPKKTPILLMHGTADWRVSPEDSLDLARACMQHKVPCRLVLFEGGDHQLTEYRAKQMQLMREWFDQYVKAGKKPPSLKMHGA